MDPRTGPEQKLDRSRGMTSVFCGCFVRFCRLASSNIFAAENAMAIGVALLPLLKHWKS